ncbi:lipase family protein [Corynebacterium sp. 335C]
MTTSRAAVAAVAAAALPAGLLAAPASADPAAPADPAVGNSSVIPGSAEGSSAVGGALPRNPAYADPATDPFYEPPADVPAAGTVIRTAPAQHLLQHIGVDWPGTAQKIMYASVDAQGAPTAVTGLLFEPVKEWEGDGPRPTVVVAPGTLGQGRQCAPSAGYGLLVNADAATPTLGLNYELTTAYQATARGARVIVTDYMGMGTPGPHTYVNSTDEAHAVLDAARAANALAGDPSAPVAITGYSQGGGAAASAAERASEYAPALDIRATYAGAPPADLREVLKQIDGTLITGAIGYALNAGIRHDPALEQEIDPFLTDDGRDFLRSVRTQCIFDTAATWGLRTTDGLTADGSSFSELLSEVPRVAAYVDEQKLGRPGRVPDHPIYIDNSDADDVIPPGQATQLARDYCTQGGHVVHAIHDYRPTVPKSVIDHVLPMLVNQSDSFDFLFDALNGASPESNCGSF